MSVVDYFDALTALKSLDGKKPTVDQLQRFLQLARELRVRSDEPIAMHLAHLIISLTQRLCERGHLWGTLSEALSSFNPRG